MEPLVTRKYGGLSYESAIPRQVLLYFTSLACVLGMFVFSGVTSVRPVYFTLAYGALFFALLNAFRLGHDWLNPLFLIIIIGFIRFSAPGVIIAFGGDPDLAIFNIMRIQSQDWMLGHTLAVLGLLGVAMGWLLNLRLSAAFLRQVELLTISSYRGLPLAATLCMLVGCFALVAFVGTNVSIEDAVYGGELRQSEIQVGSGKYFYLASMLVASSVLLTGYLSEMGYPRRISILPAAFAALFYSVLGGRVMAVTPLAAAGIVLWYRRRIISGSMRLGLVLAAVLLPVFSHVGRMYRGGLGIEGVVEGFSLSSLVEYTGYALWVDWGNLHSMAAAVMIGPGVLGGRTFSVLLWPVSKVLDLPGQSAGVLMVTTLVGVGDRPWGFHASLIGDAYLNFGLFGVLGATIVFGIVLRILYGQLRVRVTNPAIYALAAVFSLRIFHVSIEEFPLAMVTLAFTVFVVQLGRGLTLPSASAR